MKIIALDIETTGQHLCHSDKIIAIGACVAETKDGVYHVLRTKKFVQDLGKFVGVDWKEHWSRRSYEQRCYDEFWSKHLDVLDALQKGETFGTEETMMRAFNVFLEEEEADGDFALLFDTVLFDSVWLDTRLRGFNFAGLSRLRNGTGWRSAYELDSFRFGVTGAPLGDWKELEERLAARKMAPQIVVPNIPGGPHDPVYDAVQIFLQYANLVN